ncbi:MAG: prepilin peptidase [Verrucomicrobiales bacterium]
MSHGFWQSNPTLQLTLAAFSFILGACIGSFLNVVIYRLPRSISVANPKRSFCPACQAAIPWYHNLPLLSWVVLRGKCAKCRSPISPRYLLVELVTATLFLLTYLWFRHEPWRVMPLWIFLSFCVAATYIDFDHMIIPDQITYGGTAAGILCSVVFPWMIERGESRWINLAHSVGGAVAGFALVWLVVQFGKFAFGRLRYRFAEPTEWEITQPEGEPEPIVKIGDSSHLWTDIFFRKTDRLKMACQGFRVDGEDGGAGELTLTEDSVHWEPQVGAPATWRLEDIKHLAGTTTYAVVPREAMGLGDVKFMALVGAFLGWKGILFTLFAASIIGSLVALLMIAARHREWAARIPFGPYLALGAALWVFYGPAFVIWYAEFAGFAGG